MTEELLPCPFCGSSAEITNHARGSFDNAGNFDIDDESVLLGCSNKECMLNELFLIGWATSWDEKDFDNAAKKWNTRKGGDDGK